MLFEFFSFDFEGDVFLFLIELGDCKTEALIALSAVVVD
jgi:hypothetical protein